MAKLGDYIREECHPLGSLGAQELCLIGVSNEHGLHASSRDTSADLARYQRIEKNWFAYNPMRVNVGSIGLADDESKTGFTSPDYTVFSCREGLDPHYLLHFLKSDYGLEAIARNCSGAVRKRLYYSGLAEIELPVPSVEEQLAFVKRIDHISETICFICHENSERHELPQLKQAILQEAIQGKLTADWRAAHPDVEPASQLLHRIQDEKARLIAAKKLRPEKPLPKIAPAEIPFEIPKSWEWCRLVDLGYVGTGATPATENKTYYENGHVPWITSSATGLPFVREAESFITEKALLETNCTIYPKHTLLVAMYGQGKTRGQVTELLIDAATNQACAAIVIPEQFLQTNHFTKLVIRENYHRIRELAQGGSQPNLNLSKIKSSLVPLPPLAEQAAIVERVEALMTTCRLLEAEIEHARTHAAHLLQAVLKEAFTPTQAS